MFALKPYAQCVSNHDLSVQDMGRCRLLFNAQCVDDVHIVRYHDERDGSTHVQFLGMRRADDILFYCADLTKMSVSVSSNDKRKCAHSNHQCTACPNRFVDPIFI
jgi:hypothetical protein